jgi:uncharacterized damage-inducible protein DinB
MVTQAVADVLERLTRDILTELSAIPEEALNWQPPLPDSNSLYALATHTVGAGEWWVLRMACDQPRSRDRAAEFRASGDLDSLQARFSDWLRDSRPALEALPTSELGAIRRAQGNSGEREYTVAWCLLHAVDHTATHLGHIQLTRQLWEREHETKES